MTGREPTALSFYCTICCTWHKSRMFDTGRRGVGKTVSHQVFTATGSGSLHQQTVSAGQVWSGLHLGRRLHFYQVSSSTWDRGNICSGTKFIIAISNLTGCWHLNHTWMVPMAPALCIVWPLCLQTLLGTFLLGLLCVRVWSKKKWVPRSPGICDRLFEAGLN